MRISITLLLISISGLLTAQNENWHPKVDTIYQAPHSKEIFFYNGIEAPERIVPDFVLKHGQKEVPFEIDETCEEANPMSCVSLYHFYGKDKVTNKWMIRSSKKVDRKMKVIYGQKIGEEGDVVYSEVHLMPADVEALGYGDVKGAEETRYLWIVSANWED